MNAKTSLARTLIESLIVALGVALAWSTVAFSTSGLWTTSAQGFQEVLYFSDAGEPLIYRQTVSRNVAAAPQAFNLSREPVPVSTQNLLHPEYAYAPEHMGQLDGRSWHTRLTSASDGGAPATYWYLVHDGRTDGRAYGVGYHSVTGRLAGYFSKAGFRDSPPPREDWFHVEGNQGLSFRTPQVQAWEPVWVQQPYFLLLADGKLWSIELGQRQVRSILDASGATGLGHVWRLPKERPAEPSGMAPQALQSTTPKAVMVRESERLIIVDPASGEHASYTLPNRLADASVAGVQKADGTLTVLAMEHSVREPATYAVWFDAEGNVTRQEKVELAGLANAELEDARQGWFMALAAPVPLAGAVVIGIASWVVAAEGRADSYAQGLGQMLPVLGPGMLFLLAVSAGLAALAWRRQRRFGLPHAAAWAAFVLLLGVPGWIAYRFHRTWPVLADCPACQHPSPRDRNACLECGAPYPPPRLKGTEVFA
jgi:hypothetical protein